MLEDPGKTCTGPIEPRSYSGRIRNDLPPSSPSPADKANLALPLQFRENPLDKLRAGRRQLGRKVPQRSKLTYRATWKPWVWSRSVVTSRETRPFPSRNGWMHRRSNTKVATMLG